MIQYELYTLETIDNLLVVIGGMEFLSVLSTNILCIQICSRSCISGNVAFRHSIRGSICALLKWHWFLLTNNSFWDNIECSWSEMCSYDQKLNLVIYFFYSTVLPYALPDSRDPKVVRIWSCEMGPTLRSPRPCGPPGMAPKLLFIFVG